MFSDASAFSAAMNTSVANVKKLSPPNAVTAEVASECAQQCALNALAAVAVGLEVEVGFGHVAEALSHFRGVGRRFETRGEAGGVRVVDDYGHHPTEIRATLAAARSGHPAAVQVPQLQPPGRQALPPTRGYGEVPLTAASLAGVTGWYAIVPLFALGGLALCAAFTAGGVRIGRLQPLAAGAALAAWAAVALAIGIGAMAFGRSVR